MEIKMKAVEMRLAGIPVKEVMDQLCIKNKTQLKTWMRWYRNGETHRFEQPVHVWERDGIYIRVGEIETRK